MRFLISTHPLSLLFLNTIGPKRDAWRGSHTLKPHPFRCVWGWGSLRRAFSIVTPPPFGSPATSLLERPMGFAPPPHGGFAFIAAPQRQSARDLSYKLGGGRYICRMAIYLEPGGAAVCRM